MMEQPQVEQTETTAGDTAPAPELNLNDLMMLKNVLDVVTTRGAFKANELSSVGVLYDKLDKFLASVAKTSAPAPQGE
jgi:hypothetical protein